MRPSDRGRVDAAGPVDAQTAPTRSLENAQPAFSTAPTRVDTVLPMSSDKSVTHVSGSSGSSRYLSPCRVTRKARALAASKPGVTWVSSTKLRISSPAPVSSTTASAISPTTSNARTRWRRPRPSPDRPPSRKASVSVGPALCRAGSAPKARLVPNAMTIVNQTTVLSTPTWERRGMSAGSAATRARVPQYARPSPATPPTEPRTADSVSSCLMRRARPAPSAARTASSSCRAVALASSRLATLAHATSSTRPTAPNRTNSGQRTSPSSRSASDAALNVCVAFVSGNACCRSEPSRARSSSIAVTPRPGRTTPMTARYSARRPVAVAALKVSSYSSGAYTSTDDGSATPGASTPTTVCGRPATVTMRPSTSGSPPNVRCQKPWASTTTPERPGRCSSVANPRPRPTGMPSMSKSPSLTLAPRTSRGSPAPSSVKTPVAYASTASKVRLPSRTVMKSGAESAVYAVPSGYSVLTTCRRSASRYGSGSRRTPCTTLKMALVAPMPSASVSTATAVKPGARRRVRSAYATSCRISMVYSALARVLLRRSSMSTHSRRERS